MAISTKTMQTRTDTVGTAAAQAAPKAAARGFKLPWGGRIKAAEQIFFFSQLSLMIEIGTSLTGGLRALAEQNTNPVFKEILLAMLKDIEEGRQLSDAMLRHQKVFNPIYISLVRAGEAGGFLKNTLDSIVAMQERRQALITQLRSALTYPVILCIMAVVVVIFVLVGILPKFMVLFAGKERLLPPTTRVLMVLSASLRGYWWAYIAGGVGFVFAAAAFLRSRPAQEGIDIFLVRAPLVAPLFNKISTCQLLRTLGHLMESHVPLLEALEVTKGTFKNQHFVSFVERIRQNVQEGGRFAHTFARNPFIMETVKQMVATGEEVGNLPKVMLRLAKFYDSEVERDLKIIASLVEPLALVVLGTVVGLIVASVILPIFRIATTAQ